MYLTHTPTLDGRRDILVCVDPAYPNRWREAPYYDRILRMAAERGRVVVSVGSQAHIVRAGLGRTTKVSEPAKPA